MRRLGGWYIAGAILLGAIFWPWLIVFAAFVLIVAIAGAISRRGR